MKKFTLFLFCITINTLIFSQSKIEKYSRARIYYNNTKTLNTLINSGIPMDHGKHKKGVFIESDFSISELNIAKNLGATVEILINDVQKFYIERNKTSKNSTMKNTSCSVGTGSITPVQNPNNYNHGSMGGFLTYSEVMAEIDSMTLLYPNLITTRSPIDTFTTHEGRNLYWVRISDNANTDENEPEILYDAVHHAREPISVHQLIFYMWYLLENYATNPEIQAILDNTELYFIPFVNPDGFLYNESIYPNGGGMWRKNRRDNGDGYFGVDNNRNYDYNDVVNGNIWGTTGISPYTYSDIYCGPNAFSEPENQAMKWFVNQHDFKIALNNHSYGNLLNFPFEFEIGRYCPDSTTFEIISDAMVSENALINQVGWELYEVSGGSDDWMYGDTTNHHKIYAFIPEIGSSSQGFWPSESDIDPLCHNMIHFNLTAAHLLNNYAETNDLQPSIIDNTSGYFKYSLKRLGLNGNGNFTVNILPISSNILNIGNSISYTGMFFNELIIDSISYSLDPSINPGEHITYALCLDNGLYTSIDTITLIYGNIQTVVEENGSSFNNWTSQNWDLTNSSYYSPSSSITDSPFGQYTPYTNSTIIYNNSIDLNNVIAASLSFYAKWEIELNWDYAQVEVSTDGGSTWIPQCGKYTKIGTADQDYKQPVYDGIQSSWVLEEINLSDYIGQNIKIRFKIITDNENNYDGFYFDDFKVSVINGTTRINSFFNQEPFLGNPNPNPAQNSTIITYQLPNNWTTSFFNINNELGQPIYRKKISNDQQSIRISLSDIAPGVYYYFIENEAHLRTSAKKLILLK